MKKYLLTLISTLLLLSCAKEKETYIIEVIDGVKHIHNLNPKWGDEKKISLEFVRQIGGVEEEREDYQFYVPFSIEIDKNENIYVLDIGNSRILKYDKNWSFITSFGKKGQGLGELEGPYKMSLGSDGNLYVFQSNNVIVFSDEGIELKRILHGGKNLSITSDLYFLSPMSPKQHQHFDTLSERGLIWLYDQEINLTKNFGRMRNYQQFSKNVQGNKFDMVIDDDDNIYVNFRSLNRIEKYDINGNHLFTATRTISYEKEWTDFRSKLFEQEVIVKVPTTLSINIQIDNNNRLWIRTAKRQIPEIDFFMSKENIEFEVFDINGILLTRIPIPRTGLVKIQGNRLFITDEITIHEYRIIEN